MRTRPSDWTVEREAAALADFDAVAQEAGFVYVKSDADDASWTTYATISVPVRGLGQDDAATPGPRSADRY